MFRVGMKVVCVDDGFSGKYTPWRHYHDLHGLTKGAVYTIRAIGEFRGLRDNVWLDEIHRPPCFGEEFPYAAARFRPVTSPKQEVSFTTGAPEDSERWDNRVKRKPQKAITALQS